MRIYKILKKTNAEGPGNRFCIWVQGCSRHCKGCFAKETWDFSAGTEYSSEELFEMIKSQENIEGVTFLGGEPFEQASEVLQLTKLIKAKNLSVVCFTGFKIEDLKSKIAARKQLQESQSKLFEDELDLIKKTLDFIV